MPLPVDPGLCARAAERRVEALPRAIEALQRLAARGVDAGVIGSSARDTMFPHSDGISCSWIRLASPGTKSSRSSRTRSTPCLSTWFLGLGSPGEVGAVSQGSRA